MCELKTFEEVEKAALMDENRILTRRLSVLEDFKLKALLTIADLKEEIDRLRRVARPGA
jgi:hypothetical protein